MGVKCLSPLGCIGKSPLRTSPDDSQDFSFYEEETYMDVVMRNKGTVERHNQLLILAV